MPTATKKNARKPAEKKAADTPPVEVARMIPVDRLHVDPANRDIGDITELASSVEQHGILQPLLVTGGELAGHWLVVAGARRLAAAESAGLTEVPCVVRPDLDPADRDVLRLIENLERRDLTPIEEATAYQTIIDTRGVTQTDLARRLSRSQGHISKRLRLLALPDTARDRVDGGQLLIADALNLAQLDTDAQNRVLSIGNADAMRRRIDMELARAADEARTAERIRELTNGGVEARRAGDGTARPSWRMISGADQEAIDDHVFASIAGAVVWGDGTVQWFCTDPDHDHTPVDRAAGGVARAISDILDDEAQRPLDAGGSEEGPATGGRDPAAHGVFLDRVKDRLEQLAAARATVITDGLARFDTAGYKRALTGWVAAQQLDMVASMSGEDVIPLTPEGADRARAYLGVPDDETDDEDAATAGLRARLLDGRVAPLCMLVALTLGDVEDHLAQSVRWRPGLPCWNRADTDTLPAPVRDGDADDASNYTARSRVITRHYELLTDHLGYTLDPLEWALLHGADLNDEDVQAYAGLTDDGEASR